ncbi:MAG TPA: hypothetical protein VJL89_00115, partial [Thermodesulfovibrionia bacterium]|nr:hypothetical protein [Thermodesulfovibrionia bacterium]
RKGRKAFLSQFWPKLWNLNVRMKTFVVYQATKKRLDAIKSTVKEHYLYLQQHRLSQSNNPKNPMNPNSDKKVSNVLIC